MNFSELIQAVRRDPSSVVVPASWGQGRGPVGGRGVALGHQGHRAVGDAGRPFRAKRVSVVGPQAPH
ncbi:thioesterase family protein, partial [Pseudomonas aeruginosa]